MRYLAVLVVIVLLFVSYYHWGPQKRSQESSNVKNVSSGVIRYGNETLASLQGNGLVTLDGTYVRKSLIVNGSLDANDAHIGSLKVNGQAKLNGTNVDGKTEVNGFLSADKSTFQKEIAVSAHKVQFSDCTLDSIVIKKTGWAFGSQVVELLDKTVCKGSITFEAGDGKIIVSDSSQILGAIQGAEVEKK